MKKRDLDAFVRGLKIAMDSDGWKMKPLSEAAGMGESAVRDLFRYSSSPKVSTAHAISTAMGRSVDEIISLGLLNSPANNLHSLSIMVSGHVGAGAEIDSFAAYEPGDGHYRILCPPQLSPRGIAAVEVIGDSMLPIYPQGSVLFYSRTVLGVPAESVGRICVCEDNAGRGWVKQIRTGRDEGTFTLVSLNPDHDHRHGVRLKWAAPVRFSLPPEFVRRLD